jgi:hypothetical protein
MGVGVGVFTSPPTETRLPAVESVPHSVGILCTVLEPLKIHVVQHRIFFKAYQDFHLRPIKGLLALDTPQVLNLRIHKPGHSHIADSFSGGSGWGRLALGVGGGDVEQL